MIFKKNSNKNHSILKSLYNPLGFFPSPERGVPKGGTCLLVRGLGRQGRDGPPGELALGGMAFSSAVLARCSSVNRWLGSSIVTNNFPLHQLRARKQCRLPGQRWHSLGPCSE